MGHQIGIMSIGLKMLSLIVMIWKKMWDELTDAQKAEVKKLDDYLREHRKIFEESPVLLKYAIDGDAPKSHWWWYLPIENDES